MNDPGALFPAQGYAAHYCSRADAQRTRGSSGCSMILSGLRLFDISDVKHPREVAYFNKPVPGVKKLTVFGNGVLRDVAARVGRQATRSGTPTPTRGSTSSG